MRHSRARKRLHVASGCLLDVKVKRQSDLCILLCPTDRFIWKWIKELSMCRSGKRFKDFFYVEHVSWLIFVTLIHVVWLFMNIINIKPRNLSKTAHKIWRDMVGNSCLYKKTYSWFAGRVRDFSLGWSWFSWVLLNWVVTILHWPTKELFERSINGPKNVWDRYKERKFSTWNY